MILQVREFQVELSRFQALFLRMYLASLSCFFSFLRIVLAMRRFALIYWPSCVPYSKRYFILRSTLLRWMAYCTPFSVLTK